MGSKSASPIPSLNQQALNIAKTLLADAKKILEKATLTLNKKNIKSILNSAINDQEKALQQLKISIANYQKEIDATTSLDQTTLFNNYGLAQSEKLYREYIINFLKQAYQVMI